MPPPQQQPPQRKVTFQLEERSMCGGVGAAPAPAPVADSLDDPAFRSCGGGGGMRTQPPPREPSRAPSLSSPPVASMQQQQQQQQQRRHQQTTTTLISRETHADAIGDLLLAEDNDVYDDEIVALFAGDNGEEADNIEYGHLGLGAVTAPPSATNAQRPVTTPPSAISNTAAAAAPSRQTSAPAQAPTPAPAPARAPPGLLSPQKMSLLAQPHKIVTPCGVEMFFVPGLGRSSPPPDAAARGPVEVPSSSSSSCHGPPHGECTVNDDQGSRNGNGGRKRKGNSPASRGKGGGRAVRAKKTTTVTEKVTKSNDDKVIRRQHSTQRRPGGPQEKQDHPRPSSSPPDHALRSPQLYLNDLLTTRGYSTRTYPSLSCGYRTRPTPLQLASYGTVVLDAVRRDDPAALSALLRCGLSRNPCNKFSDGILAMACKRGRYGLFAAQVDAGAEVRTADDFGRTPLHHAVWAGHAASFEIVERILDAGRDGLDMLRITDSRGKTPLDYVTPPHWRKWIEFLERKSGIYWPERGVGWTETEVAPTGPVVLTTTGAEGPSGAPSLPDPDDALPVELAAMVASGKVVPEQVGAVCHRPPPTAGGGAGSTTKTMRLVSVGKAVHVRALPSLFAAAGAKKFGAMVGTMPADENATEPVPSIGGVDEAAPITKPGKNPVQQHAEALAGQFAMSGRKQRQQLRNGKKREGQKRKTVASRCA